MPHFLKEPLPPSEDYAVFEIGVTASAGEGRPPSARASSPIPLALVRLLEALHRTLLVAVSRPLNLIRVTRSAAGVVFVAKVLETREPAVQGRLMWARARALTEQDWNALAARFRRSADPIHARAVE